MPRSVRLSLRAKLIATTIALTSLVVVLFGVIILRLASADLEQQTAALVDLRARSLDELGRATASSLARSALSSYLGNSPDGLLDLLAPIITADGDNDVLYAFLIDTGLDTPGPDDDGQVWAAIADPQLAALLPDDAPPLVFPDPAAGRAGCGATTCFPDLRLPLPDAALVVDQAPLVATRSRTIRAADGTTRQLPVKEYAARLVDPLEARVLAVLVLGYSLERVEAEEAALRAAGEREQDALRRRVLLIGALAIALGLIIAVLQSLGITRGLSVLSRAANRLAEGELHVRAAVSSSDEIGQLGDHFNTMARRLQALLHETREKAILEKELDIARSIQETLIPPPGLVRRGPLSFCGYFKSASVCGGDFWHHDTLDAGRVLLTIGDVTGHGVPSAMISAAARSGLDTLRSVSQGRLEPPAILAELNHTILATARRRFVMTFAALAFDLERRQLSLANAGHNFPLLVRAHEGGALRAAPLVARGPRLGDQAGAAFTPLDLGLKPGDVVFLYTDGLTEYRDAHGREFGERRLRRLLEAEAHRPPDALLALVLDALARFAHDTPQQDDITIVIARLDP